MCEIDRPTEGVRELFRRSFHSVPPDEPRHFVALLEPSGRPGPETAGYVHFTQIESSVYLCGGLCVDARLYRTMTAAQRAMVAAVGSLSRWLSVEAIHGLGQKRAVFAYTGDARSRRDALAIGFVPTEYRHLFVQWHAEAEDRRGALIERIGALGPF